MIWLDRVLDLVGLMRRKKHIEDMRLELDIRALGERAYKAEVEWLLSRIEDLRKKLKAAKNDKKEDW